MCVSSDWNSKGTCKPEVCNLQNPFLVNQEILWFQVAMENTTLMAEQHPSQQLKNNLIN